VYDYQHLFFLGKQGDRANAGFVNRQADHSQVDAARTQQFDNPRSAAHGQLEAYARMNLP
jgi:hypothetical protein